MNLLHMHGIYATLANNGAARVTTKEYNQFMLSDYVLSNGTLLANGQGYNIIGKKIAPGVYTLKAQPQQ